MSPSEPADEPPPRMKRGAFPTPRSEIERAPRFEPESESESESAVADDISIDGDATTPGTDDGAAHAVSVPDPNDHT